MAGLAFEVFLDTGIVVPPVPISAQKWNPPQRALRPALRRNVARESILV